MKKFEIFLVILILLVGLVWRLYHIEFGLPHSFHADEPEIVEPAIKYTYEIRNVIANNDWYKLVPVSYVYGTFPVYVFTAATMFFSKFNNLVGFTFEKTDIYIFLRSLNAVISLFIIPAMAYLFYRLFKSTSGALITAFLLSFNWKFLVHAHYVNPDLIVAVLLTLIFLTAHYYYKSQKGTKATILIGILMGLAIGTKITAGFTLPLLAILYIKKRDLLGYTALLLITFSIFALSNPFSILFYKDFIYRMYLLQVKENGLVFDSADFTLWKYLRALLYIVTPLVLAAYLYGKYKLKALNEDKTFHYFLIANITVYILFFTFGSRRVDRWMLPIIPLILMYASYGITVMRNKIVTVISLSTYMILPVLLLLQFQTNTPKSASYIWMRQNLEFPANTLVITEEGLDPLSKLEGAKMHHFQVYESEGAQFSFPENPLYYKYIVLSSKPMQYFKNTQVEKKFPHYTKSWREFEATVSDPHKFKLIQQFVLPKPNLVNLSDIFIYQNLNNPLTK